MKVECSKSSELISEVNSQPLHPVTDLQSPSKRLVINPALSELTQQTLIDVNSQPFSLKDNNTLVTYQEFGNPNDRVLYYPSEAATDMVDNPAMITEFYERFATGNMFPSLADLRTAAYEYGKKYNVALTTSKSDKTKVYLICKHGGHYRQNEKRDKKKTEIAVPDKEVKPRVRRSQKTGCECMIYARCSRDSFWMIRKSVAEHNHPIAEDPRTYAMYRSLSPENLLIVHRLLRERVGVSYIVKSLRASGVTNVIAKDIENIQQDMKRRDTLNEQLQLQNAVIQAGLPITQQTSTFTTDPSSSSNPSTATSEQQQQQQLNSKDNDDNAHQ
ncbi:hypothetical protein BCV72DRAFT_212414 [Rhizopus microsporus var. microsporus]|uniref:FAR1 domain-containing protein n=1 Tax=Rhizopus microsporus var. microsporus TaxID=86635 RepID=A0A1X0QVW2_RHIZD|nr:hypothetical protein BCV72DRAFT_212414 [Rhizopus microsporus var. microsporus]